MKIRARDFHRGSVLKESKGGVQRPLNSILTLITSHPETRGSTIVGGRISQNLLRLFSRAMHGRDECNDIRGNIFENFIRSLRGSWIHTEGSCREMELIYPPPRSPNGIARSIFSAKKTTASTVTTALLSSAQLGSARLGSVCFLAGFVWRLSARRIAREKLSRQRVPPSSLLILSSLLDDEEM